MALAPVTRVGVAVSGGSDSMAMLRLAAQWARAQDVHLAAVTVDHGLRPEAGAEAQMVAETCAGLGIAHDTLHWQGWDGSGNLQDQARSARYHLIARWARRAEIPVVLLGHTQDDQAETLLMRLARASGVDGLSAMSDRMVNGVRFARPLLGVPREDLRGYLRELGQTWAEDPSNSDLSYDRVQIRAKRDELSDLGLTNAALARVADNLAEARTALNWAAHGFAQQHVAMVGPDVTIRADAFTALPAELQRRLLSHALRWISGADYAPRRAALAGMLAAVTKGEGATLHGCRLTQRQGKLWLFREFSAVENARCAPDQPWANRWRLSGPTESGDFVAALGANGQALLPDWRQTGRPAASLRADPGIWRQDRLIAAPLSGMACGWAATQANDRTDFHSALLSH